MAAFTKDRSTIARNPIRPRRIFMCVLGVVISGVTVGMFKHVALGIDPFQTLMADLGVSPYDAVALIWSLKQSRIPFFACRVICDFACVIIGTVLCKIAGFSWKSIFEVVGFGTIVTAFFMGPLIGYFNKHVSRPLLDR